MHPLFPKADELSHSVIGAAIEVHRLKGPGLLESIYEKCFMRELELRQIAAVNQRVVRIDYKGFVFEEPLRFDVLVEECLLLELKSVQEVLPIHKAQLLSYMKLLDVPLGLLINFHEMKLVDGIHRLILPGANPEPKSQFEEKVTKETKSPADFVIFVCFCSIPRTPELSALPRDARKMTNGVLLSFKFQGASISF